MFLDRTWKQGNNNQNTTRVFLFDIYIYVINIDGIAVIITVSFHTPFESQWDHFAKIELITRREYLHHINTNVSDHQNSKNALKCRLDKLLFLHVGHSWPYQVWHHHGTLPSTDCRTHSHAYLHAYFRNSFLAILNSWNSFYKMHQCSSDK